MKRISQSKQAWRCRWRDARINRIQYDERGDGPVDALKLLDAREAQSTKRRIIGLPF